MVSPPASLRRGPMPFDDELKELTRRVRETFGRDAWEDARNRALAMTTRALPDDLTLPFDGDAVFYDAFKSELRRLLHEH